MIFVPHNKTLKLLRYEIVSTILGLRIAVWLLSLWKLNGFLLDLFVGDQTKKVRYAV